MFLSDTACIHLLLALITNYIASEETAVQNTLCY